MILTTNGAIKQDIGFSPPRGYNSVWGVFTPGQSTATVLKPRITFFWGGGVKNTPGRSILQLLENRFYFYCKILPAVLETLKRSHSTCYFSNNRSHIIRRKSKMINTDSKNALSMIKFDMEIAKT